jgi:hypothetical protein
VSAEDFPAIVGAGWFDDLRRQMRAVAQDKTDDYLLSELAVERPYDPARGATSGQQLAMWRAAVKVEARRRGLIS